MFMPRFVGKLRRTAPNNRPKSGTLSRMVERLTEKEVRHIAKLARLHLTDEQVEMYRAQLSQVLEHVNKLAELDLEDVEPLSHPNELTNRLADDSPRESFALEVALKNAPQTEGPYIAVPKVLGDSGGGE